MWRAVSKIALSVTLMAWLLSRTPVSDIRANLLALDLWTLFAGFVLSLIAWWISAVRLWVLAPDFTLQTVVRVTFIALYYGTVLPGQVAGDIVKAYQLSHAQSLPREAIAATVIDRAVATLALFLLGACLAPWVQQAPHTLSLLLVIATAVTLIGMLVLAQPRVHASLMSWLEPREAGVIRRLPRDLVDGMHQMLQRPLRLIACFVVAVLFHGVCVAIHMVLANALDIQLSVAAWFLVYAGVALLTLLPITIGGLGLREGGYVGCLSIFGIGASQALSLSLVFFAYILLGATLGWIADMKGPGHRNRSSRALTERGSRGLP